MLVVAYQRAVGVSAQGSLTRAAEAEEKGYVAILAFIGRAMHAQHLMLMGQYKVKYAEYTFLHFARICRAAYQYYFAGKVHYRKVALARTVSSRVGYKTGVPAVSASRGSGSLSHQ